MQLVSGYTKGTRMPGEETTYTGWTTSCQRSPSGQKVKWPIGACYDTGITFWANISLTGDGPQTSNYSAHSRWKLRFVLSRYFVVINLREAMCDCCTVDYAHKHKVWVIFRAMQVRTVRRM